MRISGTVLIIILVVGLIAFLKQAADCENAGGEYVRKMSGLYTCIVGGRELE